MPFTAHQFTLPYPGTIQGILRQFCSNDYVYVTCVVCTRPPEDVGGGGGGGAVREGGEEGGEGEGGGWDVDDDLEIPEDIGDVGPATSEGEGYFVPPTKGSPPSQV